MALTAEQKILGIGILTLIGWMLYSRNKEAKERQKASNKAKSQLPADVSSVEPQPRRSIQRAFKVVMPSDLVAPDVRRRANEITDMRYSVDKSKLI